MYTIKKIKAILENCICLEISKCKGQRSFKKIVLVLKKKRSIIHVFWNQMRRRLERKEQSWRDCGEMDRKKEIREVILFSFFLFFLFANTLTA